MGLRGLSPSLPGLKGLPWRCDIHTKHWTRVWLRPRRACLRRATTHTSRAPATPTRVRGDSCHLLLLCKHAMEQVPCTANMMVAPLLLAIDRYAVFSLCPLSPGEDFGPAPDLDHMNPDLREGLKHW